MPEDYMGAAEIPPPSKSHYARYSDEAIREMMSATRSDEIRAVLAASLRDSWDACLDVDPFTGQPDHEHGDSCEGNCE